MKGASMQVKLMGKILISVFIVGVIVVLVMTFLPQLSSDVCRSSQLESIGRIFQEANSVSSRTVRSFTVESCMEYVDFSPIKCTGWTRGEDRFSRSTPEEQRCYEILRVGQARGDCRDFDEVCIKDGQTVWKCDKDAACGKHPGDLRRIPGGYDNIEISCGEIGCRLTPGRYVVEVGRHSVEFSNPQN